MSKLLYREDAFHKVWKTEIEDTYEKEGLYFVSLKETAFYPGGGGQPADQGTIAELDIRAVESKEGVPYYGLESKAEGKVDCQINWAYRFDLMQQHTGQHLLSAAFRLVSGRETIGFHLGKEDVTIDLPGDKLTEDELTSVEQKANELIYDDRLITSYHVSAAKLAELPVVKQPHVTEDIRIVEIDGVEYNPCGGTHVASTGQIGMIKILKTEKQKQGQRIYFQCGKRALETTRGIFSIMDQVASQFQTSSKDVLPRLKKQSTDLHSAVKRAEELERQLEELELQELIQAEASTVVRSYEGKNVKALQRMAAKLLEAGKDFVMLSDQGEQKLVVSHDLKDFHCGKLFSSSLSEFGGKGGGSVQTAQASFQRREDLERYMRFLQEHYQSIV
ncbi:DHHA1 domain-containing protein [Terribacillus sp. 179-K 1B1 HS]|uniref:alanyl-tRNA editing protein n=1 Tax=Terribacillus sp. 179-K 1B1 HS TaxID=3142388 RepID=UPI0039A05744